MPRPALTPEQRSAAKRRIQRAAAELYAEKGLGEISVRSVADRAGVSVGSIYAHFDSLAVLMQSLWKVPVARLFEQLTTIAESKPDPVERLRALLKAYARFADDHHGVYRGAFMFVRPEAFEKPTQADIDASPFIALVKDAIRDGQKSGQFRRGNSGKLAQVVWAGLHGALALPVNIDRLKLDPPQTLARGMIDAMMVYLTQDQT